MGYKDGQVIWCVAPFVKDDSGLLGEGYYWHHGIRFDPDECSSFGEADGEGAAIFMIIKVVELGKPFVDRILYRKKLIDPDRVEGDYGPIKMLGERAFRRLSTGARWEYEIL